MHAYLYEIVHMSIGRNETQIEYKGIDEKPIKHRQRNQFMVKSANVVSFSAKSS